MIYQKCKIQPVAENIEELFQLQETLEYIDFAEKNNGNPDGNFICVIEKDQLPSWFHDLYKNYLEVSDFIVFLKNKGNVIKHTDVHRLCSLTIPLNISTTPTLFWKSYESETHFNELYHDGEVYLQNNAVIHSVPEANETRYFLQISFEKSFENILYQCEMQKNS